MANWRPLATATSATLIMAVFAVGITGGHSPFAAAKATQPPVADEVAAETATPGLADVQPADEASPTPENTSSPTAKATPHPKSGGSGTTGSASSGGSGASSSSGSGATPPPPARPTPKPTAKPAPTATPSPKPTGTPAPVSQGGTLRVSDSDAGPHLTWTECTASTFAAYAVVRSLDSEIHFPVEDLDTVVAMVTSAGTTSLTDAAAPNQKVYYAVWCLSRSDAEYRTIWKTPTVGFAP